MITNNNYFLAYKIFKQICEQMYNEVYKLTVCSVSMSIFIET